MSNILKRTKKSCSKFFRKIYASRQSTIEKLDNEDEPENNDKLNENEPSKLEESVTNPDDIKDNIDHADSKHRLRYKRQIENISLTDSLNYLDDLKQCLATKLSMSPEGFRFRRLKHKDNSYASQLQSETASDDNNNIESGELVFERIKFKENIRYLRHTPSMPSLESFTPTTPDKSYHNNKQNNYKSINKITGGLKEETNGFTNYSSIEESLETCGDVADFQSIDSCENEFEIKNKQMNIIKSDINGNPINICESFNNWEEFCCKINKTDDMRVLPLRPTDSPKSCSNSSSSTTVTWVEDELIYNHNF